MEELLQRRVTDISATAEWAELRGHARWMSRRHLRELFDADPRRCERLTTQVGDLVVDWSRHRVTDRTLELLLALADRAGVTERIAAMVSGQPINTTEGRPVLHTALRSPAFGTGRSAITAGSAASTGLAGVADPAVAAAAAAAVEFDRMAGLARALRAGTRLGATGRPIRTVVNLGIGGSHLGMVMAHEALAAFRGGGPDCRFVSNVDPSELAGVLGSGLDPAETLFVVVSKSFTTPETLANARAARAWVSAALGTDAVDRHFVAVSSDTAAAVEFGVSAGDVFRLWDWVGGRFSLGSAAAVTLMAAIGEDHFSEMLAGMRAVDEHLAQRPLAANAPAIMGLLAVWYRSFLNLPARAVLPYSQRLHLLPAYLQQLHMESNGKRVRLDGTPVAYDTGPIVWGAAGTGGQHSFHQFLHQGTTVVPADFVVFARPDADTATVPGAARCHEALVANCLAQAATLAFGTEPQAGTDPQTGTEPHTGKDPLAAHRELPGNRPSTVIMAPELTPAVLGQLVALYEHEVLVQGAVWGINSFDQFGVEQGKTLAAAIAPGLSADPQPSASAEHDPSTASLIAHYRKLRSP